MSSTRSERKAKRMRDAHRGLALLMLASSSLAGCNKTNNINQTPNGTTSASTSTAGHSGGGGTGGATHSGGGGSGHGTGGAGTGTSNGGGGAGGGGGGGGAGGTLPSIAYVTGTTASGESIGGVGPAAASCSAGSTLLSGGCRASDSSVQLVVTSPADASLTEWDCAGHDDGESGHTDLYSYAICTAAAGLERVASAAVDAATQTAESPSCPAGKVLVGGGCQATDSKARLQYGYPAGDKFVCRAVYDGSAGAVSLRAYAVCAPENLMKIELRQASAAPVASKGAVGPQTAACNQGETVVGGGCDVDGPTAQVTSTYPEANLSGWTCGAKHDGTGGTVNMVAYALCAHP